MLSGATTLRVFFLLAASLCAAAETPLPEPDEEPPPGFEISRYVIPAVESIGFHVLLNQFNRNIVDRDEYGSTWASIGRNLHESWIYDTDPFAINQLAHPYLGSLHFGFARSAGLSFWESLGYAIGGSTLWELTGEPGAPSVNDAITTSIGGSFLGEALFRMAEVLLDWEEGGPGLVAEIAAFVVSPPTGFNRFAYDRTFDHVFCANDPAIFPRIRLGGALTSRTTHNGPSTTVRRGEAVGDFTLDYGLPGKPGYRHDRPFDWFHFELAVATSQNYFLENLMTTGFLLGTDYAAGRDVRGICGLFGSYDFITPEIFRVSSTALSLGTTFQAWLSRKIALQGTVLAGVGFGAAGLVTTEGERDYHFGLTPQGLLSLRLVMDEVAALELAAREYYVSDVGGDGESGSDGISRAQVGLTVRLYGPHAVGLQYVLSRRRATYREIEDQRQTVGTLSLVYTLLGDTKLGVTEWRDAAER